jgi:TRAP-type C4-dicarboxylate transport system substrate-binding protein
MRPSTTRALLAIAFLSPLALVGYGLWLGAATPAGRAHVLRLGHGLNRDHPVHKGMEFMAADLLKRSDGRLRLDLYPDEQLGPERDLI